MDWYPWYIDLYEADTLHLTATQDGIYRRLLDWYMAKRRPLPNNDNALAAIARIGSQEWLDNAQVIRAFFTSTDKFLRQKRCDIELDRQDRASHRRSEAGKKGAEIRWRKNNMLDGNAMAKPWQSHSGCMAEERRGDEMRGKKTLDQAARVARCNHSKKEIDSSFAAFWQAYPRKVGKRKAESIYRRLVAKGEATTAELLAGAEAYSAVTLARDTEPQFIAHPTTWLNRGSWADDAPQKPTEGNGKMPVYEDLTDDLLRNKWKFWENINHQKADAMGYHGLLMLAAEAEARGLTLDPPITQSVLADLQADSPRYRAGKPPRRG